MGRRRGLQVILVDANLLIFSATACPEQDRARGWLDSQLNSSIRVGMPWQSLLAFLRITTSQHIYGRMVASADQAWGQVEAWLGCSNVWIPEPTPRHAELLGRNIADVGRGGNMIPDAHLATLAMEHGLTLCSSDRDFALFTRLNWTNPLR